MAEECKDNWTIATLYNNILFPAIASVVASCILVITCIHIKDYMKGRLLGHKLLFYSGAIFCFLCLAQIIVSILSVSTYCHYWSIHQIFGFLGLFFYGLQYFMLIAILWTRLYIIFNGSSMELSRCTNASFITIYILSATIIVPTAIFWTNYHELGIIFVGITAILIVALVLFLVTMFVNKLLIVHRNAKQDASSDLLKVITKTSSLMFISISVTIWNTIMFSLSVLFNSLHYDFPRNLFICTDVLTNFICILLTYNYYDKYYQKICGKCDQKCHRLWTNISSKKKDSKLEISV